MTDTAHTRRALSFDTAATQYDTARPGYPPALLDAVEELAGRPLKGARVVDVGAGTGLPRGCCATFLDRERAELLEVFPDGTVEEAHAVDLTVALRDPARPRDDGM